MKLEFVGKLGKGRQVCAVLGRDCADATRSDMNVVGNTLISTGGHVDVSIETLRPERVR